MSLESYAERLNEALNDESDLSSRETTITRVLSMISWLKAEHGEISKELVPKYDLPNIVTKISQNEDLNESIRLRAERLLSRWRRGIYDAPHTAAYERSTGPGDLGLVVGECWPDREAMHKEGCHASLQAGICGQNPYGAYSIVANGGYNDLDKGETLWYSGTDAKEDRKPTAYTKYLMRSVQTGNPIRVIRGEKCGEFAPQRGFRYDGLYIATASRQPPRRFTASAKGEGNYEFHLERIAGQPPIQRSLPDNATLSEWHAQKLKAGKSLV